MNLTKKVIQETFSITKKEAAWVQSLLKTCNVYNHKQVDQALDELNKALSGYGVEAIRGSHWDKYYQDINLLYINFGETYSSTIIFDCNNLKWYLCSWGDFVERYPKRFQI